MTNKKNNNTLLVKLSLATMLSAFSGDAFAQTIDCIEPLSFGEIIACGAAGTVTVRPDGSSTQSCVTVGSAPQSRGRCTVSQSFPFRPIQINVNSTSTSINNGGGGNMNVNNFNIVTNSGGTGTTITAPFVDVPIGATLNVGATQASGTYSGTMGVTAVLQ